MSIKVFKNYGAFNITIIYVLDFSTMHSVHFIIYFSGLLLLFSKCFPSLFFFLTIIEKVVLLICNLIG